MRDFHIPSRKGGKPGWHYLGVRGWPSAGCTITLIRILRGARADPELIKAVRLFRCENCTQLEKPHKALPAAAPGRYMFNYEIIVDVFEEDDAAGTPFLFLSIACDGTVFHLVTVVAEGTGQPSSTACFRNFMET